MERLPEKVQKEIRQLSIEDLRILFEGCINSKKIDKDRKAILCKYIEKRLNKLLKEKDYNDKSLADHEYIAKWGVK